MRIFLRKSAPAFLAVLYGTLVVLGHALHHLPGLDHFALGEEHQHGGSHCCCHHQDESASLAEVSSSQGCLRSGENECAICSFLATAHNRASAPMHLAPQEWVTPLHCFELHPPISATLLAASARGPPAVLNF